jgi:hypothetical protein
MSPAYLDFSSSILLYILNSNVPHSKDVQTDGKKKIFSSHLIVCYRSLALLKTAESFGKIAESARYPLICEFSQFW